MKKILKLFMALIYLVLLMSGIVYAGGDNIKEIRIADGKGDWGYPNPYRHYPRGPGYIRMSMVYDTLVWKNQDGYIPALAESWSWNQEKMAFTFKLNPAAKWHDGRPVTAADVVFTIEYFKKHPYNWISTSSIDRAEAPDGSTVVIYLSKPYAPFLSDIGGTMPIMPKHVWEKVDDPKAYNGHGAYLGSGPYVFKDFNKAKGTYLYEAFPDYYQGRPRAARLIYIKSGKPLISLCSGQADVANIKPDMAPALEKKGMVILSDKRGWNKKLMINHRKAPFNDRRFRAALAHAIDQQEIIDKAHRGYGSPASFGLLSKDHDMYNPDTPTYEHDRAKAAQLLESLGYKKNKEGFYARDGKLLTVEILVSNISVAGESVVDRDGEVIRRQLEQIGIKVDLLNLEQATTDSRVKKWDFDLAVSGHGGLMGDARIINEMISSKYGAGSVNSARFEENAELLKLLDDQMLEMDEEKRKAIVYKIQEVYARELPAISLFYPETLTAYNPKKGVQWYYTKGGVCKGIPIAQNKMSLLSVGE